MQFGIDNYISRRSLYHRLNPTVKLIVTIMLIVVVFLPVGFFGQIVLFIVVYSFWILAKLPWRVLKSILLTAIIMTILLFVVNWVAYKSPGLAIDIDKKVNIIFGDISKIGQIEDHFRIRYVTGLLWGGDIDTSMLHDDKPPLNSYWTKYIVKKCDYGELYLWYRPEWYSLSSDVIFNTFNVVFKIVLMITIITLLVSSTSQIQLTYAIEELLFPLSYIKIPVNEWAITISVAIRFVPSLLTESQNILKAQASRGVDFGNGNIKDKVKSIVSLVVPMFSIAFHKADDLSNAMEARSYNPRYSRTNYRNYRVKTVDLLFLFAIALLFGMFITYISLNLSFGPFNWIEIMVNRV
ncbi:MAG: energy-coupling factor transporter transmembrane component T [Malacoplasma sp.]|nr:energy-coupling factor transporter transmembrane component T [Mycoplasmataceae bacterium]MDD7686149.1 energy-coupling factor transporter transmembrane component T [Mycoplasmataceae bacterium]MDY2887646.1 energy-coupling factor transporter transmembrane component T [Malacoplasma sp.]